MQQKTYSYGEKQRDAGSQVGLKWDRDQIIEGVVFRNFQLSTG